MHTSLVRKMKIESKTEECHGWMGQESDDAFYSEHYNEELFNHSVTALSSLVFPGLDDCQWYLEYWQNCVT